MLGIKPRLHCEVGLLAKTRRARRRWRIAPRRLLVAFVPACAVIRIEVLFVLRIIGCRISVIAWLSRWFSKLFVRHAMVGGTVGVAAPIIGALWLRRPAIAAGPVHRRALTDEPCQ